MTIDRDLAADLRLGLELAGIADAITLPYYEQRSFNLDWKSNHTEVTEADRETESAISGVVLAQRPGDGLLGEEHGVVGDADSPWRWVIDPDRRHLQLRPRHPGVGHVDRVDAS